MLSDILNPKTAAWPASLAAATVLGSFALACVFPFVAFATLAALTMKPRTGLALVASVWAANQFVGFFVMSFPWELQAAGHGIAILASTLAAYYAARLVSARLKSGSALQYVAPLVVAFAAYLTLMRAYAQFGGGAENFTLQINSDVAVNDALWFAGLMVLRFALTRFTGQAALPATA